jgi:hypothetical protein
MVSAQSISLHFRGEDMSRAVTFSTVINNLTATNVLGNALNPIYKIQSGTVSETDGSWTFINPVNIDNLQIANQKGIYTIFISIEGYGSGSDAGILLEYVTGIDPVSPTYIFKGISQDVIIWNVRPLTIASVVSSNGSSFVYGLIKSVDDITNNIPIPQYNDVASLNTAISTVMGQYGIVVYCLYAGINTTDTVTFNLNYL